MKFPTKHYLVLSLAVSALIPVAALATNGMFMIGYGEKAVSVGGAAIAFPQDTLAGAVNPAAISETGTRIDVSGELFLPNASATLGNLTQESRANTFVIPNMGGVMKFNRKLAFGFTAVGAGGGGSRYNLNLYNNASGGSGNNAKTLGVSLMVMQMSPTIALNLTPKQSVGVSLVMGLQQFRAFGLDYFSIFTKDSPNSPYLTKNGNHYAWGAGLRMGWLGKFLDDRLMLGAAATSKVFMHKFTSYQDLFAQSGGIDTPANLGAGMSFKLRDDLTFALDVQRVFYSGVNSIANDPPQTGSSVYPCAQGDVACQDAHRMGADGGLGFGWKNQTIYKLGLAYQLSDKWTVRGGWNYGKSPIPSDNGAILVNIVAPATTQSHMTMGATYNLTPSSEVSFAYMHAFRHTQYGPTYIGSNGSIGMSQNSYGASFGMKF
ncbi:MAG: OmpP1/FadL family transporter [Gammaproteobacteria bacterium]